MRRSADSSYHVFTEASYFHRRQENVFDSGKINLNVTFQHQSPFCLSLNYYIIKFSALTRDRMDWSPQDWNTIQHLQSSCFLWIRQMLHGLENNCDSISVGAISQGLKYIQDQNKPSWLNLLKPGSDQVQAKIGAKIKFLLLIVFHFSVTRPSALPFTDVFNALATKGQEAVCVCVRAAGWCWGWRVASAVLEWMSAAASPLQATPLIGAADTGPSAVLAGTRRQLRFIISVLVAESHLDWRHHREKLNK